MTQDTALLPVEQMDSIYNNYHCCPPVIRAELGLPAFDREVRVLLQNAKAAGYDYNHVALEMIQSVTAEVAQMHIKQALDKCKEKSE